MKILYHHRTQAEDGQAVHIRSLQRALLATGHELCEVGLVSQGGKARPGAADRGGSDGDADSIARQRARWSWVGRLPRWLRELAEYAYSSPARRKLLGAGREFRPAVIYERYAFGNTAGVSAAHALGIPLLLEVNSPMVEELSRTRGLSFPRLARSVEDWIFRSADRVLAVTEVLRGMLIERGVDPKKVVVIPNGVDLELYATPGDEAARARARRDLGLEVAASDLGPVLGFVGYYRDWHRLDLALDALCEPGLERAQLVLIGEGPARDGLVQHARERGVEGRLHLVGRREHREIPALLPAFDIALVPAINPYASPLKLHEYMAAGIATVAPDQPNLREVLVHGHSALLVPPGDGDAFGAAILRLAKDARLAQRLGLAARQHVEAADLTWSGNARRVVRLAEEARRERGL